MEKVSFQEKSNEVAKHLNSKLHAQAKNFIAEFNSNPEKCMTLDIPHLINSVDEHLLKFITMPIRDSRRKLFHADIPPSTQDDQSYVRLLYIISLLLFNTNSSCYMPLHYLLTEAILCHGGSIHVFNKINWEL